MVENPNTIMSRLIEEAGISRGMRVLDLGCGKGDVTLLAEKLVGPTGEVVGIDRNPKLIEMTKVHVDNRDISNVRFINVDLSKSLPDLGMFDAIVGRRVLMYLHDPADILYRVLKHLKNDGIVAFLEIDSTVGLTQISPHPLHVQAYRWIWETIRKEGANLNVGFSLPVLLAELGVSISSIKAEANIQGQTSHSSMSDIIRAMKHRIVEHGVATEGEIDIETLEDRLKQELSDGSIFIGDMSFSIIGRKTSMS